VKEFRVVVVVSRDQSDLYFANQLIKRVNVVGVIVENQTEQRDTTPKITKAIRLFFQPLKLLNKLYDVLISQPLRKNAIYNKPENQVDFGEEGRKIIAEGHYQTLYTSGVKDINAADQITWLKDMRPDVVAICGASIMKEEILSVPSKGSLNLHGGLSQEYRGLFTTDWAIHNEQPEYVGSTVHYVSPGIDDGNIIYQSRPEICPDDHPNSLYEKIVIKGVNMMERAINEIESLCLDPTEFLLS